jgi:hypothetical protein
LNGTRLVRLGGFASSATIGSGGIQDNRIGRQRGGTVRGLAAGLALALVSNRSCVTLAIGAMLTLRSGQLFTNQYRRRGTIIELLYRRHRCQRYGGQRRYLDRRVGWYRSAPHFLFPSTAMDVLA